ncbi:SGNH/GDSL hydrolase family protein [Comamonas humi]
MLFRQKTVLSRRSIFKNSAALLLVAAIAGCGGGSEDSSRPVGTWGGALSDLKEDLSFAPGIPAATESTLTNQTVRQTVHLSVGGDRVRIKFGNLYGRTPVSFERVRIALSTGAGTIDRSTDTGLTFGGAASVIIPPGVEVWSDAVPFKAPDAASLAVSIYVKNTSDNTTAYRFPQATHYVSVGDTTSAAAMPTAVENQVYSSYWMSAVDVYRSEPSNVLVVFGDSITAGAGSTWGADRRYSDLLSDRFLKAGGSPAVSVVNKGLSGNRWLHDRFGLRGVERFKRDVLSVSGVTHTIILLGINDIGYQAFWLPTETATADELIAAVSGAVSTAKAAGIKVYLGTLTPFSGAAYFTTQGEQIRQALNAWIRANKDVDGVIDFDAAVRDPADATRFLAANHSGDNLHPSDAGYLRMADSVPLEKFR